MLGSDMPDARASLFAVAAALAVVLAVLLGLRIYRKWKWSRIPPEEHERQRRARLVATGKMGDATLVEIRDDFIFYHYAVRGAEYTASQDVSRLAAQGPPADLSELVAVSVKYDPRNPANSIVIAEEWSGLRASKTT